MVVTLQSSSGQSWWMSLFNFLRKYNPIAWFFRWLSKFSLVSKFIQWIKEKVSPRAWHLIKESSARGAMAAVGGAGSALVQKFMESKDGKWDRALVGGVASGQTSMFGNTALAPVQRSVSSFGYGSQPVTDSSGFPFGT